MGAGARPGRRGAAQEGRPSGLQSHADRSEARERLSNFAQLAPQLRGRSPAPSARRAASPRRPGAASLAPPWASPRRGAPRASPQPGPPPPAAPRRPGPTCALSTGARPGARSAPVSGRRRRRRAPVGAGPAGGGAVPAAELLRVAGPPSEEAALVTPASGRVCPGRWGGRGRAGPEWGWDERAGPTREGPEGLLAGWGAEGGPGTGARGSEVLPSPPRPPGLDLPPTCAKRRFARRSPRQPGLPTRGPGSQNAFHGDPGVPQAAGGSGLPAGPWQLPLKAQAPHWAAPLRARAPGSHLPSFWGPPSPSPSNRPGDAARLLEPGSPALPAAAATRGTGLQAWETPPAAHLPGPPRAAELPHVPYLPPTCPVALGPSPAPPPLPPAGRFVSKFTAASQRREILLNA